MKINEYRVDYDSRNAGYILTNAHIDASISAEEARLIDDAARKGISITMKPTRLGVLSEDIFNYCYNDVLTTQYRGGYTTSNRFSMVKKVIFNGPATIVLWNDGTKTVVKLQGDDKFDPEKGFALCCAKKLFGNKSNFNNIFKEWIKDE